MLQDLSTYRPRIQGVSLQGLCSPTGSHRSRYTLLKQKEEMSSGNTNPASVQHEEILTRRVIRGKGAKEGRSTGPRVTIHVVPGRTEVRIQTDPDSASHRLPWPLCVSVSSSKKKKMKLRVSLKKRCYKTHRSFKDTVTFLETVENIVRLPSVIGKDCTPGNRGYEISASKEEAETT